MSINIEPYQIGNTHITDPHTYKVLQGKVTVIYYVKNKKIIQHYKKTNEIFVCGEIPHLFLNCTSETVKLKLLWKDGKKNKICKNLQYKIIFITGYSCNKLVYKNITDYFQKFIKHKYAWMNKTSNLSIDIEYCDWTTNVYKGGLDTYLNKLKEKNKNRRLILICHSWGCQVGINLAANSKNIEKIILLDYHPFKKMITTINKEALVKGFFPNCSKFNKEQTKTITKYMSPTMIKVSKYLTQKKSILKKIKNIPVVLIYSTLSKVVDNNIEHLCVNKNNTNKIKKDLLLYNISNNITCMFLYNSSHFWFMNNQGYNDVLSFIWEQISNTICDVC